MIPPRWKSALCIGVALGCLQCEEEEDELTENCLSFCQELNCGDGYDVKTCKKGCVDRREEAEAISDNCAGVYRTLVACIAALPCPEPGQWLDAKGTASDYPCKP